jgi:hypothetical protein
MVSETAFGEPILPWSGLSASYMCWTARGNTKRKERSRLYNPASRLGEQNAASGPEATVVLSGVDCCTDDLGFSGPCKALKEL